MAAWEPYSEPGSGGNGSLIFPPPPPSYSVAPTLTRLKAMAKHARNSNPRVNAVMTTPPALSWSATAPTGLTNIYNWSAARGGVFDFAGGSPLASGNGYRGVQCATFSGVLQVTNQVVEFVADAAKVVLNVYETAAGYSYRVSVNGQYVSTTPLASTAGSGGGAAYITIDFTSAGGRAARLIRLEGCTYFGQVYVGATEGVYKPNLPDLRMIVVGDSYVQGLGATFTNNPFAYVLKDCLGVRDMWASGVGGTGYLNPGSGQATARGRITDLTRAGANPDVIVSAFGHNDGTYAPSAITAEVLLYLAAIRSAATTASVPIFVTGVLAGNASLGTLQGVEAGIALAVAEFGDPNIIFIPCNNDVNGAWMTGTGNTSNLKGDGNADVYISTDNVHPNDAGHSFYGMRLADAIMRALQTY